jgi:predicted DNA binding CopG/RHH family protein
MIHSGTTSLDPSHLIKPTDTPLLNWHAVPTLPAEIPPNPNVYPISSSTVYPSSNVIETSFEEVLNAVFPINEINEDFEYLAVPYINCLDSNQTFDDDDFENEQFLTDLNEVNNKQHNRVQVNEDETVIVNLGSSSQLREIRIGATLDEHERAQLEELLKEFVDVFAWSYDDMPGIDPEIAQHEIPTLPDYKPVKQKLRKLRTEWSLKVKEEVVK